MYAIDLHKLLMSKPLLPQRAVTIIEKSMSMSHACLGCGAGAGGAGLKHCSKNAVYITNAIEIAINAYMNMFSSGCLNLFFLSHSSTSSSDMRSPKKTTH